MSSRISYNIHAQLVRDVPRLKKHLLKIQPTTVLVMDSLGLAKEIKALLPNCVVIHRNYSVTKGDDDVHKRVSPQQWLDLRAKESEGGIYLYTTNEPAFDTQTLDWHIELMRLAGPMNVKLVIGNWGVGNPQAEDWGRAKQMLELLDRYRDRFILGLHEYWCGVPTSGLYGGYPDNAGVQPGTPGGQNLIMPDKWPKDVSKITLFHCGRFKFLVNYCQTNNIKPPRIILTEHGADDVSDIKAWAEGLQKTPPYTSIRGWKSLRNQWNAWFGANTLKWSPERAYFEQLAWADRTIYQNSIVEGQCVFSWGHSSDDWEQFDIEEAGELQELLETYAAQQSQPKPAPLPVAKPANYTQKISGKALAEAVVRIGPGEGYPRLGKFSAGEIQPTNRVRLFKLPGAPMPTWCPIYIVTGNYAGSEGWLESAAFQYIQSETTEVPTIPPESPAPQTYELFEFTVKISIRAADRTSAEAMIGLFGTVARAGVTLLSAVNEAAVQVPKIKEVQFDVALPKKVE